MEAMVDTSTHGRTKMETCMPVAHAIAGAANTGQLRNSCTIFRDPCIHLPVMRPSKKWDK